MHSHKIPEKVYIDDGQHRHSSGDPYHVNDVTEIYMGIPVGDMLRQERREIFANDLELLSKAIRSNIGLGDYGALRQTAEKVRNAIDMRIQYPARRGYIRPQDIDKHDAIIQASYLLLKAADDLGDIRITSCHKSYQALTRAYKRLDQMIGVLADDDDAKSTRTE